MKIHLIAIGGAVMHNLAIALHRKGFKVSGSDDEIFDPSKSRLEKYGLLPKTMGWNPENIHKKLDAVILGMHARYDNPELKKAKDLGLKVYSFPEYVYEQSKNKTRVVIAGSHGKTSITAIIMHILNYWNKDFDYLVGSQLEGFETMVRLSDSAKIIILEGDEYLSSPLDQRPKFLHYHADIALISGIAWDHINVFPTFENYKKQFSDFIKTLPENAPFAYDESDLVLKNVVKLNRNKINKLPYIFHKHEIINGKTNLIHGNKKIPIEIFGEHNLKNLNGAKLICKEIGVLENEFYEAIKTFKGAARRLEKIKESENHIVYRDFAHSPSKLKATTKAVKNQFKNRTLVAVMELHTFSSLNEKFLEEYKDSMNPADEAIVYFNPNTIKHKKLKNITKQQVQLAFNRKDLIVFNDSNRLKTHLDNIEWENRNLLLMSSGNFNNMQLAF